MAPGTERSEITWVREVVTRSLGNVVPLISFGCLLRCWTRRERHGFLVIQDFLHFGRKPMQISIALEICVHLCPSKVISSGDDSPWSASGHVGGGGKENENCSARDDFGYWARSYRKSVNGVVDDARMNQLDIVESVSGGAMRLDFETSRDDLELGKGQALVKANEDVPVHRLFHFSISLFL